MGSFFAELKRRHIYRVAAAYAVVAWVLLQLVNNLAPGLNLPNWAVTLVIVILAIGFPLALIFAWIRELPPADSAITGAKTNRLDWALMGALIVVIALVSYQQLAGNRVPNVQRASPAARDSISIAVLPFVNLSGDANQEFFSDGVTEEITTALAKVQGMTVIGRTSAFEFKGQNRDLRRIGQQLGASHLIEGSIRKAGNRVRVSAQLIEAGNGAHLWAENYDRELTDIFAVQEDIATAITGALRVPLGLPQGERLVSNRTDNLQSYDDYLRAKALVRARGTAGFRPVADAAALLEQVVIRDPNYGPAWAQLALAYATMPTLFVEIIQGDAVKARPLVQASLTKGENAAAHALQLAPNLADTYVAQAYLQYVQQKFLAAEELFTKALALDANNPDALNGYSVLLADVGRVRESLSIKQKLQTQEPFVPVFNNGLAHVLWLNGQTEQARAIFAAASRDEFIPRFYLSRIYAADDHFNDAADLVQQLPEGIFLSESLQTAARVLRAAPNSPQEQPNLGFLNWVYIYTGKPEVYLGFFQNYLATGGYFVLTASSSFWHPSYEPLRKLPQFKTVMRGFGFVEYWRAKGWPDFCRPTTADDFECS